MKIVIRTDSSNTIGSGHVMRCVTLAKQLKKRGFTIVFVCRKFSGNSISYIRNQGFGVEELFDYGGRDHWSWIKECWELDVRETRNVILKSDIPVSMVIIDHYSIDNKWEKRIRQYVKNIVVIDDLANRQHECDLLLDQNYYTDMEKRYDSLLPEACIKLLGPNYVLLRDEFLNIDIKEIKRKGPIHRILIFFGGSDPTGETLKTLESLSNLNMTEIFLDVVVGQANSAKLEIEEFCRKMSNVMFHIQVTNMAELMVEADLAIGAGGATTWERCFLLLPSIIVTVAENQTQIAFSAAQKGTAIYLGDYKQIDSNSIALEVINLIKRPEKYKKMVENCSTLMNREKLIQKDVLKRISSLNI